MAVDDDEEDDEDDEEEDDEEDCFFAAKGGLLDFFSEELSLSVEENEDICFVLQTTTVHAISMCQRTTKKLNGKVNGTGVFSQQPVSLE